MGTRTHDNGLIVINSETFREKAIDAAEASGLVPMVEAVTAVVCSYLRPMNLESCLSSLWDQDLPSLRILVVGVEHDTQTQQVAVASSADFIAQLRPEGISAARNIGIAMCKTPVIAFIDDDARARTHWAASLADALSLKGMAAIGGPVFNTETGEQVVRPWHVDSKGVTHDTVKGNAEADFPTVNGCNMAFRRDALKDIGGFDPYYSYYYDETDVCVRLVLRGYRVGYVDDAVVDHDFADGPTRDKFLYYSSRMRAYFSMKNFGGRVSTPRLLFGQGMTLKDDWRAYHRLRPKYAGMSGFSRAVREVVLGRFQGVVDGMTSQLSHHPSLGSGEPEEDPWQQRR